MEIVLKGEPDEIAVLFRNFFAQNTEKCVKSLGENMEKCEISEIFGSFDRLENFLLNNKVNSQNEIAQLRKDR